MKRDVKNGMISGVCAGIAKQMGVSVTGVRIVFILLSLWLIMPALIYLILWATLPVEGTGFLDDIDKIYKDPENGVIGGVCAGISQVLGWDLVALRLLWLFCVFCLGFGIVPYLILWIVLPKKPADK